MKTAYAKQAASVTAVFLLAVTVAGCQLGVAGLSSGGPDGGSVSMQDTDPDGSSDSPQKTYDTKGKGGAVPVTDSLSEDGAATITDAKTESSSGKPGKTSSPAVKAEDAWNAKAPKLLGIAIGDAKSAASSKLGKPADTYPLDDEGDTLTVEEYAAYSIGYSSDKKVKFVEVFGKAAATGLGGLYVGDTESAAVKKLGKPDMHTTSVLAYEAEGALLKLDLDPQNNRILSIKLFSAENQP